MGITLSYESCGYYAAKKIYTRIRTFRMEEEVHLSIYSSVKAIKALTKILKIIFQNSGKSPKTYTNLSTVYSWKIVESLRTAGLVTC